MSVFASGRGLGSTYLQTLHLSRDLGSRATLFLDLSWGDEWDDPGELEDLKDSDCLSPNPSIALCEGSS